MIRRSDYMVHCLSTKDDSLDRQPILILHLRPFPSINYATTHLIIMSEILVELIFRIWSMRTVTL